MNTTCINKFKLIAFQTAKKEGFSGAGLKKVKTAKATTKAALHCRPS